MQLQQTTIDTVDCEAFGPVTLCVFDWEAKTAPAARLVSTAKLALAAKTRRPVDAVAGLESVLVLTDEGLGLAKRLGPTALLPHYREAYTEIPEAELFHQDDPTMLRAFLTGRSDDDIRSRAFVAYEGALFDPESPQTDPPLNFPVLFAISNSYVDIRAARSHLESHPLVRSVHFDEGFPGSYAHVPSSLQVHVALPDDVRIQIEADCRAYYARFIREGERCNASASYFEQVFTWYLTTRPEDYGDLLGLARFARPREESIYRDDED